MPRTLSADFQLWQLYVIRSSLAIPVLVVIVKWRNADLSLLPISVRWVAIRSLLLAAIIIIGSLFAAIAYQKGPSSIIATFDYSYLAFSAFWGWLVFSEVPDLPAIIGMLMIAGAGFIALRN